MDGTKALRRPVMIAGPTASGKSALALAVAERDGGIVVNADALQVYACWRVLTARPSDAALARAPHALYGHVACEANYSVGAWLGDVERVLADARDRGLRPVVVGGTGLYLTALTRGLAWIPPIDPAIRADAEARLAAGGIDALGDELARRDPATWRRIDGRNPARVLRAWEVLAATGRGLAEWQRAGARPLIAPEAAERLVISPQAEALGGRIAARLERMVAEGALGEVGAVLASGLDPERPAARALGAAELAAHLRGETGLEQALAAAVAATRRYAKRQKTWARGQMRDWNWHGPAPDRAAALLDRVPRG